MVPSMVISDESGMAADLPDKVLRAANIFLLSGSAATN
jgi:hypothetical protein